MANHPPQNRKLKQIIGSAVNANGKTTGNYTSSVPNVSIGETRTAPASTEQLRLTNAPLHTFPGKRYARSSAYAWALTKEKAVEHHPTDPRYIHRKSVTPSDLWKALVCFPVVEGGRASSGRVVRLFMLL